MTEPNDVNRIEDKPATTKPSEPDKEPDKPDEAGEKEDVTQIPVKQVPMDGICGGY